MDALTAYLPPAKGYLPYYMLGLSIIAVGNSLQNYLTLHYSRRLYNGQFTPATNLPPKSASFDPADSPSKLQPVSPSSPSSSSSTKEGRVQDQVTPLAARLFGTYTLISAIVRIYASYHLAVAPVYHLALWTYVVALLHFGSEFAVYKTARLGAPVLFPFFFASVGIAWMVSQYGFYVEA
ncbi:transmembrane domain-containing protein [Whalleya microplaca]|nr:transmembrane domain-containing protein [Whalleya microplaca]